MKNDRDKNRTESPRNETAGARELTEAQLERAVGGEGAQGMRRPL